MLTSRLWKRAWMPICIGMTDVRNQPIPARVIPAQAGIHASFKEHALPGALATVTEWARQPGRKAPRRERRPSADANNHWTHPLSLRALRPAPHKGSRKAHQK